MQDIIDAIGRLPDDARRTKSGSPYVSELEKVLGRDIGSRERDRAWAAHNEQRDREADELIKRENAEKPQPVEARITGGHLYWSTPAETARIEALGRKGRDVLRSTPVVGTGRCPIRDFALSDADLNDDEFAFVLKHEEPHRGGSMMRVDTPFADGPAKDADATTLWDREYQAPGGKLPSPPMQPGYDASAVYGATYLEPEEPVSVWDRGRLRRREPKDLYPSLRAGDIVYYARRDYGVCTFLRWDGGFAVCSTGKEWLSPDAPSFAPRMGATPAGAEFWTSPVNLLLPAS